ncbi:BCCT family transporter [Cobetia sp. 14N.309.X.WAT.E.A4]|uniref:BCCT family transporter n=1 Tax=Cobetia TaxID=204286 RepID=UPI001F0B4DD5|nr:MULTISPECIES: BCCT family transporter [Cobetia]MDH2290123.1 BCCT family transporter [Cobetia sp. 10Alg 146]MDH2373981.1 BCCT family transporter [Cobetia sp. 3AK]MDN2656558.1 BCCT family transporter [Cobetia sp. 14N.309.X.WAT.E.A4]
MTPSQSDPASSPDSTNTAPLPYPDASSSVQVETSGWLTGMHKGMTLTSAGLLLLFVLATGLAPDMSASLFGAARAWIESTFGTYYLVTIVGLIGLCIALVFSPWGNLRLGAPDSRPEFSRFTWVSMLLSAGVGIGILFFGVAEPLFYFDDSGGFGYPNNPHADLAGHTAMTHARAVDALKLAFFHWGLHGWAVYVIVGMTLAYFAYRRGLPLALRSALYPLIGNRIYGPIGHAVDIMGVLGCVFGIATSLGLGVSQIAVGLNRLTGLDSGIYTQVVLIAVICAISIASAVSGVSRGIRIISELNVGVSVIVVGSFLIGGPTLWLISMFGETLVSYVRDVIPMGLWVAGTPLERDWQDAWTIFYWAWWLAWAPFIGLFIARISKGRTVREFVLGVLIAPPLIIFIWQALFGGTALHQELTAAMGPGTGELMGMIRDWNLPEALFATADTLVANDTLSVILSSLLIFLLISWFVTSSDSSTLVITTILSMGDEEPLARHRIFWGVCIGSVAAVLLMAGGLKALQTVLMAAALPVSLVILLMTLGLLIALIEESRMALKARRRASPDTGLN